jgi:hypothetical protein
MLAPFATLNPDADTREFWEYCRRRELRFQRCSGCRRFRQPPLPGCPHCGTTTHEWVAVRGRGRVFSYTVVHHAAVPMIQDDVPYVVIVVEFDDAPGVRLVSNLIEAPVETARIGLPVDLVWDEGAAHVVLPRFRPAT